MSNNSNNNKNNNNSNKNKNKDNPNAYQEFMPYWKKEEECFENETIMVEATNSKGRTKTENIPYPRAMPTDQIIYENFMSKITSGVTREFYFERDKAGNQVHQQIDGKNARYIVHNIVRVKRPDGSEWLYSQGRIEGFDSLGLPVGHSISAPEKWIKTEFAHTRRYDNKKEIIVEETTGPANTTEVYELPFNAENVQKLYDQSVNGLRAKGIKFNAGGQNPGDVQFYVKIEDKDMNISIKWSSIEESLKLFKTKEFEYLFNGDYMSDEYKREARAKSMGLTKNEPVDIPRLEKDNKNYKGYTL